MLEAQRTQGSAFTNCVPYHNSFEPLSAVETKCLESYTMKSVKLALPRFDGHDAFQWKFKAEQFLIIMKS